MEVQLAPFERNDFHRLISWFPTEADLVQWCGPFFSFPLNCEQLENYLKSMQTVPPIRLGFKAIEKSSQAVIGHIELNNIDRRNLSGTVSKVFVNPDYRGAGLAAQMVSQILELGFKQVGLHRIDLRVFDFNTAAIRTYKKCGFQIEGHLRDFRKVGDVFWSSYLMSILAPEWDACISP